MVDPITVPDDILWLVQEKTRAKKKDDRDAADALLDEAGWDDEAFMELNRKVLERIRLRRLSDG